jgi:hypothetical protein
MKRRGFLGLLAAAPAAAVIGKETFSAPVKPPEPEQVAFSAGPSGKIFRIYGKGDEFTIPYNVAVKL